MDGRADRQNQHFPNTVTYYLPEETDTVTNCNHVTRVPGFTASCYSDANEQIWNLNLLCFIQKVSNARKSGFTS